MISLSGFIVFALFFLTGVLIPILWFGKLLDVIIEKSGNRGVRVGPWKTHLGVGDPKTSRIEKAAIAHVGLGGNNSEETLYWNAFYDSDGAELTSANNYLVKFDNRPELDDKNFGFWSITVYGENKFFVPNLEKIYSINSIGNNSTEPIIISRMKPKNSERWLPLPDTNEKISIVFRCYLPSENMRTGKIHASDLPLILKI